MQNNEDRKCGTCLHHKYDFTYWDFGCDNEFSDKYGDFTPYDDCCDEWESK